MKKNNCYPQAFTLVELIVVITILAVLSTIGFISFQGYTVNARDGVRLSDMRSIAKAMDIVVTKAEKLPVPGDKVDITASGTILTYQGYADSQILGTVNVHGGGKDPLDDTFYTYSTNPNRNKFQILGFFENEQLSYNNNSVFADGLADRFPRVYGKELGVLLNTTTNQPIQDENNSIDIVNTTDNFSAYIDNSNNGFITGTGAELVKIGSYHTSYTSCKHIIDTYEYGISDGVYSINPTGKEKLPVYCDMTTDGGGWSLVFNQNKIGDFWNGTTDTYNILGTTDCIGLEENCVNKVYSQLKIGNDVMFDGSQSDIIENNYTTRYIINGVNQISGKTFYQVMNDNLPDINCKFNIGSVDIVILKDPFLVGGDSNGLVQVGGATSCINDKSNTGGYQFIIGRAHTNQAGWPTNSYSNHFHQNYRIWIR